MTYEDFLEQNGQTMTDLEWKQLDDEEHAQIAHMEDVIYELGEQLKDNNESVEEIFEVEQEEPGEQFYVWTKHRVYYSDEEDYGDQMVVRNTFRRPAWAVAQ